MSPGQLTLIHYHGGVCARSFICERHTQERSEASCTLGPDYSATFVRLPVRTRIALLVTLACCTALGQCERMEKDPLRVQKYFNRVCAQIQGRGLPNRSYYCDPPVFDVGAAPVRARRTSAKVARRGPGRGSDSLIGTQSNWPKFKQNAV